MTKFAYVLMAILLMLALFCVTAGAEADTGKRYTREEAEMLAKAVWGEARGCDPMQQAAVVWCVLNRVDSDNPYFPDSIAEVVSQPQQFHGYIKSNPVDEDILAIVNDVLTRWRIEESCIGDVGRVLPQNYLYFVGDGKMNTFRTHYFNGGNVWDWSCPNPYEGLGE